MVEVRGFLAVDPDVVQRVGDDREVAQPEEVHLQQSESLAGRVVELGDDGAVLGALHDGDDVGERVGGHDHRAGVDTPLPGQPLQAPRHVDDVVDLGVLLVVLAELGGLRVTLVLRVEDPLDGDVLSHDRGREGLRELFADLEVAAQDARGVLERLFRLDPPEGDDLGDAVLTVLALDVVDDLVAPALVEVHVEVGHRDALGVEEAFEDQTVLQGVQLRDAHRVGDHRPGTRPAPGSHADPVLLGPVDVVGDREEVAGEAHLDDDAFLVLGLPAHLLGHATGETLGEAELDLLDEPRSLVLPGGHREVGHVVRPLRGRREVHLATLGDVQGRITGLGQVLPDLPHLLGGADVVPGAVELETVRVIHPRPGVDAQQGVLDVAVLLLDVVAVVGGHQGRVHELRQAQEVGTGASFELDAVVHDLDVEVLGPEDVPQLGRLPHGLVPLPQTHARLDGPRGAAGEDDEPLVIALQQFLVRAGPLAELPVGRGLGTEPEEVEHPLGGVCQEGQVVVGAPGGDVVGTLPRLTPGDLVAVEARGPRCHVGLEPDDRLDTGLLGGRVELVGPEEVPVVRDPDRRLAEPCRFLDHSGDLGRPVEHGVLGVVVEVDESVALGHAFDPSGGRGPGPLGPW